MKPNPGDSPQLPLRTPARTAASTALMALALAGCWSGESIESDAPRVSSADASAKPLIGGFAANSSRFNAVGSIVITAPDPFSSFPYPQQVCTGTLVDDDTVITAKHCLDAVFYSPNATLSFGLGPNALSPSASAEVIAYEYTPGEPYGGFSGYGHDLAVLHLGTALADAPVATLGTIAGDDVGDRLATFGYGEQLAGGGLAGARQVGAVTVRAIKGKIYEILFGDFATFHEWYTGTAVPPECKDVEPIQFDGPIEVPPDPQFFACLNTAFARGVYEFTVLEEFNEIYAGGVEGDAQPCYGDSGGPLVRPDSDGKLVVYGVVSGSIYEADSTSICGNGATYAGLNAAAIAFIQEATDWEDPCEVGTTAGVCNGSVARRCTGLAEGERREVSFDCASVGSTCQVQKNGSVGCGEDDTSFGPSVVETPIGFPTPTPRAIFSKAFKSPGEGAQLVSP